MMETTVSFDVLKQHNKRDDAWIAVYGKVYDVTQWSRTHPGGKSVVLGYAGEDASDVVTALHPKDKTNFNKFLAELPCKGTLDKSTAPPTPPLVQDFRKLRAEAIKEGLFKPEPIFYVLHLLHIILLEAAAYSVFYFFGVSWTSFLCSSILLATAQAQAGWTQHDYGHLSVFNGSKMNHYMHWFVMTILKSASPTWWNWRHFNHHAKPNVVNKDADIKMTHFFVLGDQVSKLWAKKDKGFLPYNYQQYYWHLIGPPLLLPVYFHIEIWSFLLNKGLFFEIAIVLFGMSRITWFTAPYIGFWGSCQMYMFVRLLESHWFVWVTQMSHIVMGDSIRFDTQKNWPQIQVDATCDIEGGLFNDWFTGHLNYQIEHHLFPTMPRHSLPKIHERVKNLYAKHGIKIQVKPLWRAFADVHSSLETYGNAWREAYTEHHGNSHSHGVKVE